MRTKIGLPRELLLRYPQSLLSLDAFVLPTGAGSHDVALGAEQIDLGSHRAAAFSQKVPNDSLSKFF